MYVLMSKECPDDYLDHSWAIETIGRMDHYAKDLKAVDTFDSKEEAWGTLAAAKANWSGPDFARKNWAVVRYVVFEERVLNVYLARSLKEREMMEVTQ